MKMLKINQEDKKQENRVKNRQNNRKQIAMG